MPDVFQILKADHDEVKAMLSQLENGPKAGGGATGEQLASRRQAVGQVMIGEGAEPAAAELNRLQPDDAAFELRLAARDLGDRIARARKLAPASGRS